MRESNIEQLRKELSEIRFKDGESVDDFSMRIMGLAKSITTLGGSISETEIVQYPILTRSNYNEWTLLMPVNLQAQGLWHLRDALHQAHRAIWHLRDALHQAHRAIGLGRN